MNEFRAKITENGRILIPIEFRRQLHWQVGDELVIRLDQNELHVLSVKHSLKKARDMVSQYAKNKSLVKKLKAMRKEDQDK